MHIDDLKLGLKRWISWKPKLLELERTLEIIHSKPFILWLRTQSPKKITEWLWANFLLSGKARIRSQVSWHPVRSQVSWLLVQGSFHYTHTHWLSILWGCPGLLTLIKLLCKGSHSPTEMPLMTSHGTLEHAYTVRVYSNHNLSHNLKGSSLIIQ